MKTITDYEMRIIAFVDILGFKNLVDESVSDHYSYLRIHDALEDFRKVKKEKENEFYDRDVKVTTFSDSLVISYPLDFVGGLFHILYDLTYLQFILLQKGVFVRGGITIGKLRHVQNEIFGPAMNTAYMLESTKAIYPRIIISEDVINKGIDNTYEKTKDTALDAYSWKYESEEVYELLKKDKDGWYTLDYLRMLDEMDTIEDYIFAMEKIRGFIEKSIEIHRNNEHIVKKYIWVAEYFNTVLSEFTVGHENDIDIIEINGWINK